MKINKKILIISLVVLIVVGGIVLYFSNQNVPIINSGVDFKIPTSQKVKVSNQVVNNFYKEAFTYPTGNTIVEENQNYQIAFLVSEQEFLITIYEDDQVSLGLAEQAFLTKLGITKETACKLKVTVQTHKEPNLPSSAVISKLSYCR